MSAPSKRAKKNRSAEEFSARRLASELRPPLMGPSAYAWSLDDIRAARDLQMMGRFKLPARLAESMRTDDALMVVTGHTDPRDLRPGDRAPGIS